MKTLLRAENLNCPSCVTKIEKALRSVEGVKDARVHFATGRIEVHHDESRAQGGDLVRAVRSAGYEAKVSAF